MDSPFPRSIKQSVSLLFFFLTCPERKCPWYSLNELLRCLTNFTVWRSFFLSSLSPFLLIQLLRVWEGLVIIQSRITVSEMDQKLLFAELLYYPSLNRYVMLGKSTSLYLIFPPVQLVRLSHGFLLCKRWMTTSSLPKGGHQRLGDFLGISIIL